MPTRRRLMLGALSTFTSAAAGSLAALPARAAAPGGTLAAYRSEDEFVQALQRWQAEAQRLRGRPRRESPNAQGAAADSLGAPPAALAAAPQVLEYAKSAGAELSRQADGITNVQTAGVDEGGIVKHAGDFLVILRRGRLFTVRVGDQQLEPVGMVDAYAPGSDPQGAWYDELLISGSTVVVVGYSYARGGTEIGLFQLDRQGGLRYRSTHHLRSFDYYSSRNYASRLIGRKLIFYTPSFLLPWNARPWEQLPGLRRWHGERTPGEFRRILPATRIYRTDDDFDPAEQLALHTVTQCDLDAPDLDCESTAVLGPAGRVFYVSQNAVYVWTSSWRRRGKYNPVPMPEGLAPDEQALPRPRPEERSRSAVFRIPLDGGAPSGLKTAGVPIDQMSFLEDGSGHLNVLLRESGQGEGMWGSERTRGSMALLRVAVAAFGDGRTAAQHEHYRAVPAPAGAVQNRFVGDWLLWGGRSQGGVRPGDPGDEYDDDDERMQAAANGWALRYAAPAAPRPLRPGHDIERIEALGRDAVLVGNAGADLVFSSLDLTRRQARVVDRHVQRQAGQGETRTHGFFYRPGSGDDGLLGLPVLARRRGRRPGVYAGSQGPASVLFLRQRALHFSALGGLDAADRPAADDACKASCVDWYGNARPIFLRERVFALLGYELVEGRLESAAGDERIEELRRISFAPGAREPSATRAWPFN
jgi:hypothetical protein